MDIFSNCSDISITLFSLYSIIYIHEHIYKEYVYGIHFLKTPSHVTDYQLVEPNHVVKKTKQKSKRAICPRCRSWPAIRTSLGRHLVNDSAK